MQVRGLFTQTDDRIKYKIINLSDEQDCFVEVLDTF